ncbi:UDP-glycosyltransferase 85A2 [Selaginella moellendorffii]|uniref:UDP-glycosyltransferase 85A2 n=1 Tax=Selaginella moellendorffii TaxID=88036 RepID=UPI000D1CC257|nr:UDP-glycosyltransferase 85A2 [Selaginella moellendorffii]|eukprot:XP_024540438.1 UDP-glycosyltransferase 85A2 [Selaginella moellendorffii]
MASQGTSSPKIHVLAFPVPGQGHITPMMHLCKKIAARDGFTVSFVNVDSLHDEMIKHWRAPPNTDLRLVSIPLSWKIPHGLDAHTLTHLGEFFKATTEMIPALEHLVSKLSLEISPVRCIISDYFFFWTQDVADKFGIPRIVLWPGSTAWTTIEYHIPELIAGGHVFPSLTEAKKLVADESVVGIIKGLGPLHQADVPLYLQADDHLWAEYSVQRVPYIRKASCVLVNSFYDLEPEASDFMAAELRKGGTEFLSVGPMFLLDEQTSEIGPTNVVLRNEDDECLRWLDKQEKASVLYISFGSIAVVTVEQFEELAVGLEAIGKPFLWVLRPELLIGNPVEKYKEFCERTSKQGFTVSWAPQLRVLKHPSIAAHLSHCGWNSVLESISNGVPLMCWPWGAEQNTNAKLVIHDWKIGAGFARGANGLIGRGDIEKTLREVMDGERGKQMKDTVEVLKCKARKAVESGGRSAASLDGFLKGLSSQ